jgi:DNA-binding GntR family transcriptional regulator
MGRRTLVDDLVDGLLDDILDGRLKPHDALPPEADIAKAYDVSRLTAREALKALRAQNILYVKAGRGTFVKPRSPPGGTPPNMPTRCGPPSRT